MAITESELQELLGGLRSAQESRAQKRKEAQRQVRVAATPVENVFETAARRLLGDDAVDYTTDLVSDMNSSIAARGLKSGAAGLFSLGVELPRLAEMGYESATGDQIDLPELGYSYDELATSFDAKLPEDATEAEKALYYGLESLPMFGGPGRTLLRTAGRMSARTAQGALGGRIAEENALLGMAVGAAPAVPYTPSIPSAGRKLGREKSIEAIDAEARRLGEQAANEFGISETRGQMLYRAAQKEQNPVRRNKKLAEAERVLALEAAGRSADPRSLKEGVRSNTALWRENDLKQADQIEKAMRKLAGVSDTSKRPADIKDAIVKMYQGWSRKRMKAFYEANEKDFSKLDRSIKFDLENVVDEIDELIVEFDLNQRLQTSPQNTILKIRNKILTEKGEIRELSAPEVQAILADLGTIAWKGTISGLDDLNPGVAKGVARKMLKVFDGAIDNVAKNSTELSSDQAKLLQTARNNYKARIADLENESSGVLMEFFAGLPQYESPGKLIAKFDEVKDDPRQIKIISSILQAENPEIWTELKTILFDREIRKLTDTRTGFIDLSKLRQAGSKLRENEVLFGDVEATGNLQQLDKFIDSLEGIFATIDPIDIADLSSGALYKTAKLGSEISGSAGGAKARYVAEAATKLAIMIKGGKIPPEAAAFIASNPKSHKVLVDALKGKANSLKPGQLSILRNLARLGNLQITTVLPSIYFNRDENDSIKKTADFVTNMFQEALE